MLSQSNVSIVEGLLPGYIQEFVPDMNQYVADQIFKPVSVAKVSGNYPIIGNQGAKPQKIDYSGFGKPFSFTFSVSSGSFDCEAKELDIDMPYDTLESAADNELDLAMVAANQLGGIHADAKEAAVNDILTNNANFVGNSTPGTLWDAANSTPIADIATGITAVAKATRGVKPNTLVMNLEVFLALMSNSSIREIFNQDTIVTQDQLRSYLTTALPGITKLLISGSASDTTAEGLTASNSWGLADDCWVLYVPDNVTYGQPSYGIQPVYKQPVVQVIDDRVNRQVIYRAGQQYDLIVPSSSYGYRLAQVIS
jgi:hypothetical protein